LARGQAEPLFPEAARGAIAGLVGVLSNNLAKKDSSPPLAAEDED
jgi:hypothetical protein